MKFQEWILEETFKKGQWIVYIDDSGKKSAGQIVKIDNELFDIRSTKGKIDKGISKENLTVPKSKLKQ